MGGSVVNSLVTGGRNRKLARLGNRESTRLISNCVVTLGILTCRSNCICSCCLSRISGQSVLNFEFISFYFSRYICVKFRVCCLVYFFLIPCSYSDFLRCHLKSYRTCSCSFIVRVFRLNGNCLFSYVFNRWNLCSPLPSVCLIVNCSAFTYRRNGRS